MNETSRAFNEFVSEGTLQQDRYPYYIDLRVPVDDITLRGSFLEQVGAGLKGADYNFFADVDGRVRYSFKTEADRDLLCAVCNDKDLGYKVRAGLIPPVFSPKR